MNCRHRKNRSAVWLLIAAIGLAGVPGCGIDREQLRELGLGGLAAAILYALLNNDGAGDDGTGQPIPGADGINCWDLNENGIADAEEDTNGDGEINVLDCRGADGTDGADGADGIDGVDGADGSTSSSGPELFSVFIDDFFTEDGAGNASLPVNFVSITEPALGSKALGAADAIAFRSAIPNAYDTGYMVTMRLFFYRTGPTDGCFVFDLLAKRLRDGSIIESYGDKRFVRIDLPDTVTADGGVAGDASFDQFVVVDLPINRPEGLGYPNDLAAGQFLAFELGTHRDDGGLYELLGVELFEKPNQPSVENARIFDDPDTVTCFDCPEEGVLDRTFTINADFAAGNLFNVNFDHTPDQLRINDRPSASPYVWVAASDRGTVVRIDATSGDVLGEFLTAPDGRERYPWRVAVDLNGSAWVANQMEAGGGRGSIVRVALPDSGLCFDRNGNGVIDTSTGLADIRPWGNLGNVDDDGGVLTAQDECIIDYTRVVAANTGALAVDLDNDAWVGGALSRVHERVGGATGAPVPGSDFFVNCGGNDGVVDGDGILWSASNGKTILRYDTTAGSGTCIEVDGLSYGLAVDPATGHIWNTTLFGGSVLEIAPDGTVLNVYEHGDVNAEDVAVDHNGNVWVAHAIFGNTVGHLTTDGTFVGNVPLLSAGGDGPTGLGVDVNGKIWVTNAGSDNVMRIDPDGGITGGGGRKIGAVDLVVELGEGAGPNNLGDLTGFEASLASDRGLWSRVIDGELVGVDWLSAGWNLEDCIEDPIPDGTLLTVEVRAAESRDELNDATFVEIENDAELSEISGRFLQVRVTFDGIDGESDFMTPVLCDFSVEATCTLDDSEVVD